jgi:hypothetical protein
VRYGDVLRTPPGSKSGACTHRGDSGTWESLLSPCHTGPEDQGYRLTKSPGADEVASASQRVRLRRRHKLEGADRVSRDERAAKDLERGSGQS